MDRRSIVAQIDAEIARLTRARNELSDESELLPETSPTVVKKTAKKSGMTEEGRKRIADAMKKRWAERRAATPKKAVKKSAKS